MTKPIQPDEDEEELLQYLSPHDLKEMREMEIFGGVRVPKAKDMKKFKRKSNEGE